MAGLRFSLETGHGRSAVPVRSALIGGVLAVAVVVATVTFGSGLSTLVSHPALYGWNWSYAIDSPSGTNVPPIARQLLDRDPDVAAWTGFNFANIQVDDQTVPALITNRNAELGPPVLSGHLVDATNQIVLGAATLAALHKKVGDTVIASYGSPKDAPVYVPPTRLVIVGTATMPAIGASGALHPSMGTGALIAQGLEPASFKRALTQPDPNMNGPAIVVIRLRKGVPAKAGLASLQPVADAADKVMAADPQGVGNTYSVLGVQRPAEIVNYQSTGNTPAILAAGLAAGAVAALATTLAASVRRRRRDPRVAQGARVHPAPACGDSRLAGFGRGDRRDRRRRAGRDRPWPLALGPVRPRHLRSPRALGAGARGRRGGPRCARAGKPRRRHPRAHGRPDADGSSAASGMRTAKPAQHPVQSKS